jgi:hypothetical protein
MNTGIRLTSTSLTVDDHCMLYPTKWATLMISQAHVETPDGDSQGVGEMP